uniref:Uncharacterized protein n=1 Tax=Chromera velia CCMP2878 TaxID=1169474 RepID=A0A0G4I3U4_9ALVE|eukprot:Cvel_10764.t1-p1 / transcript=Cvel_10764.t1 / gene=Cvel_10764 / organism=Chromera_velia_CCMP2878 / gene_product=hypothetical protein / transcript_product=hypothetical protein / location=Cvel_scaffold657:39710-43490(+) / protein_length=416 / sequence_SO=supercontig / SO=protein_coding / is_pseudo=false
MLGALLAVVCFVQSCPSTIAFQHLFSLPLSRRLRQSTETDLEVSRSSFFFPLSLSSLSPLSVLPDRVASLLSALPDSAGGLSASSGTTPSFSMSLDDDDDDEDEDEDDDDDDDDDDEGSLKSLADAEKLKRDILQRSREIATARRPSTDFSPEAEAKPVRTQRSAASTEELLEPRSAARDATLTSIPSSTLGEEDLEDLDMSEWKAQEVLVEAQDMEVNRTDVVQDFPFEQRRRCTYKAKLTVDYQTIKEGMDTMHKQAMAQFKEDAGKRRDVDMKRLKDPKVQAQIFSDIVEQFAKNAVANMKNELPKCFGQAIPKLDIKVADKKGDIKCLDKKSKIQNKISSLVKKKKDTETIAFNFSVLGTEKYPDEEVMLKERRRITQQMRRKSSLSSLATLAQSNVSGARSPSSLSMKAKN